MVISSHQDKHIFIVVRNGKGQRMASWHQRIRTFVKRQVRVRHTRVGIVVVGRWATMIRRWEIFPTARRFEMKGTTPGGRWCGSLWDYGFGHGCGSLLLNKQIPSGLYLEEKVVVLWVRALIKEKVRILCNFLTTNCNKKTELSP